MAQNAPGKPGSWHWKMKNTAPWAESWLAERINDVQADGVAVKFKDIEGDCELGMRKSKLVTIYDLKVTMNWTGELGVNYR